MKNLKKNKKKKKNKKYQEKSIKVTKISSTETHVKVEIRLIEGSEANSGYVSPSPLPSSRSPHTFFFFSIFPFSHTAICWTNYSKSCLSQSKTLKQMTKYPVVTTALSRRSQNAPKKGTNLELIRDTNDAAKCKSLL